jgi:hypothetical protein
VKRPLLGMSPAAKDCSMRSARLGDLPRPRGRATCRSTTRTILDPIRAPLIGLGTPPQLLGKPDRATYESSRRAELDRIRPIDIKRRQLLAYFQPLGIHEVDDLWDRDDRSRQDREERDKAAHELHMSHRVLVHAVEGYLLGCVEYPDLTGEGALRRATSTDSLIDLLQAEEDLMIRTFGPPWVEHPVTLSRSRLNGLQPPGAGKVPTRGSATSGTPAPWSWPWR